MEIPELVVGKFFESGAEGIVAWSKKEEKSKNEYFIHFYYHKIMDDIIRDKRIKCNQAFFILRRFSKFTTLPLSTKFIDTTCKQKDIFAVHIFS